MPVYVALIRAIGPETHKVMRMAALREACESAGLTDVTTVGNTGNIIFRSEKSETAVRKVVQQVVESFGLGPANEVFIDTPRKMAAVVKANPFPKAAAERPAMTGVCTFHKAPDWEPIVSEDGPEHVATVGAHLVIAYPDGVSSSKLNIEKRLGGARMTMRNWRVFAGLAEKATALAKGS